MITAVIITTFLIAVFAIITVFVAHRVDNIQEIVDNINALNSTKVQELDDMVSVTKTDTGSLTSRLNVMQKELEDTGNRLNKQQQMLQNEMASRAKLDKRINHYGSVMNVMDEHRQNSFDILDDKLLQTDSRLSYALNTTNQLIDDYKQSTDSTFSNLETNMYQSIGTLCNLMFDNMNNMNNTISNRISGLNNLVMQEFTEVGHWIEDMIHYTEKNDARWNTMDSAFLGTSNQVLNNTQQINNLTSTTSYISENTSKNFNKVYNNLSDLTQSNNTIFGIMRVAQEEIKKMQQPIINSTTVVQEVPSTFQKLSANRLVIGPENYGVDIQQNINAQTFLSMSMKLNTPLGVINKQNQPIFNFNPNNATLSASNMKATCISPYGSGQQSVCFAPTNNETVVKGGPLRLDTDLILSVPSKGIHMSDLTTSNLTTKDMAITGVLHSGINGVNSYIKTPGRMDGEIMLARDKLCVGDVAQSSCLDKNTLIKLIGLAATNTSLGGSTTTTATSTTSSSFTNEFIELFPDTNFRGAGSQIAKQTKTYKASEIGWANRNIKSFKLPTNVKVQFYSNGVITSTYLGKYDFIDVNIMFTEMYVEVLNY